MQLLKIIAAFTITLALLFALSFLLDLNLIKQNWLRYAVVVVLGLVVMVVGCAVVWQFINELKNK